MHLVANSVAPAETRPLGILDRRFRPTRKPFAGTWNIVPLADVVLLIVLFLLVNFKFVLQPGVTVQLPRAPLASAGSTYGPMVVILTQEGIVFFNDERTTMDGLASLFSQAAHQHPDTTVVVEADHRVPHGAIIAVINMASTAGIKQVNLATQTAAEQPHQPRKEPAQ
ncbi:MAG: biopolymer transporter ExbD [Kiritimatiellae bacterium]|nr:biopolymer transporter ExbD [Kiritimatiellia bacterium]